MKLVRYGTIGAEKPGLVDKDGTLRDLSDLMDDITPDILSPESLLRLKALEPTSLPEIKGTPRLGVPVAGTSKFIAIGLNYSDHAAEAKMAIPKEPIIFSKAISCLSGPDDPVFLPPGSMKLDWEVELGFVIGSVARRVREEDATAYIAGYVLVNDVSEREWQTSSGSQWDKGKGYDTFGPVGPWLVTCDETGDPQKIALSLCVNGQKMQDGNTSTMIFGISRLLASVSTYITLYPGDIITTGTPPGVGMGKKPEPVFLKEGDVMTLSGQGLGTQTQKVVRSPY